MAEVRPAAAADRGLQVLHRPAAGGEGPRRRRPVPATRRRTRWWSAWTRSRRSRPWNGPSRSCRCARESPRRHTHDYVRHGITSLFAALDVATGKVTDACYPRHRHQEFLSSCKKTAAAYPGTDLHVVCDNYATHKHADVRAWLAGRRTRGSPCTSRPLGCSWLNLVEMLLRRHHPPGHPRPTGPPRAARPRPQRVDCAIDQARAWSIAQSTCSGEAAGPRGAPPPRVARRRSGGAPRGR